MLVVLQKDGCTIQVLLILHSLEHPAKILPMSAGKTSLTKSWFANTYLRQDIPDKIMFHQHLPTNCAFPITKMMRQTTLITGFVQRRMSRQSLPTWHLTRFFSASQSRSWYALHSMDKHLPWALKIPHLCNWVLSTGFKLWFLSKVKLSVTEALALSRWHWDLLYPAALRLWFGFVFLDGSIALLLLQGQKLQSPRPTQPAWPKGQHVQVRALV